MWHPITKQPYDKFGYLLKVGDLVIDSEYNDYALVENISGARVNLVRASCYRSRYIEPQHINRPWPQIKSVKILDLVKKGVKDNTKHVLYADSYYVTASRFYVNNLDRLILLPIEIIPALKMIPEKRHMFTQIQQMIIRNGGAPSKEEIPTIGQLNLPLPEHLNKPELTAEEIKPFLNFIDE